MSDPVTEDFVERVAIRVATGVPSDRAEAQTLVELAGVLDTEAMSIKDEPVVRLAPKLLDATLAPEARCLFPGFDLVVGDPS